MTQREWVSLTDPDDPSQHYLFDISFLLSRWECIFGAGCPGTAGVGEDDRGCCRVGAHYVDEEDRRAVEAAVDLLGPADMQHHALARRRGVTARDPDGSLRTRVVDGACIFLNRAGWPGGSGCALHTYALSRGQHPMTHKPTVCWMVPLRREVVEDIGDDGRPRWTTTITSYDRGAWGPGGADLAWWCTTDGAAAYHGARPVFESMAAELTVMVGERVYAELADYLRWRQRRARRPLRSLPIVQP